MSARVPELAWVYSLDDLSYRHDTRQGTPLHAATSASDIVFGRKTDPAAGVSVAMIRDDHPSPEQVSAMAGRVFVSGRRRSVYLANLSTKHPLYVRKWPSAQLIHTLPPVSVGEEHPKTAMLGEGIWWIWTSQAPDRTPGWILVDVLKPPGPARRLGGRSTDSQKLVVDPATGTDPDPSTHAQQRPKALDERHVDFLVATFRDYFTIPPKVMPTPVPQSHVSPRGATAHREAIIRAARPGVTDFTGLYNPDLLPFLFEGNAVLSFSDVQESLFRLGLLD